jgi:hypothetical protein
MEPLSTLGSIAKPIIQKEISRYFEQYNPNNRLEKAFEKAKEEWLIFLCAALPKAFEDLYARYDNLEGRLSKVYEDPQFWRIIDNFTYDAWREALDERRRMFAHAAAGIMEPDISIQRKARVERTLRVLDPEHVLYLHCANKIPIGGFGTNSHNVKIVKLLNMDSIGDVLASCGCVRMETGGGGAGEGVWSEAHITQLGYDVLDVLRTYTKVTPLPFIVPGREVGPQDRTKQEAQMVFNQIPHLQNFIERSIIREFNVKRSYCRASMESALRTVTFFMLAWAEWKARLEEMAAACSGTELRMNLVEQPYKPSDNETIQALRVEFVGPHDLLRHLADASEATWYL